MPENNIVVDMLATLVFVQDTKSVACSSCPDWEFKTLLRCLLHSLKHRGRCANGYPTKNDDKNIVNCCPKIVTHESCLDSAMYGAVIVIRMEIVDNAIKLRVKCNYKKENPDNPKKPLNEPCNAEFDNINDYNRHVGSRHCQSLRKRSKGRFTSKRVSIKTIIAKIEKNANFGETVIYNFQSTAWIKQPNLLYSKGRANELRTQLKLLNLVSQNTLSNDVFISKVLGFSLKLLNKKVKKWERENPDKTLHEKQSIIEKLVKELMPSVATVKSHTNICDFHKFVEVCGN